MHNNTLMKCAVAGGVIVFLWGIISWVVLPWHQMTMHRFADEQRVANVIQSNTSESGVYVLPGPCMHEHEYGSRKEANRAKMYAEQMRENGPVFYGVVKKEGLKMHTAASFIGSLVIDIIAAALVAWLLMAAKAMSYARRVAFVVIIAVIADLIITLPEVIWSGMPIGFAAVSMIDLIIAWFLGGLAIGHYVVKQ